LDAEQVIFETSTPDVIPVMARWWFTKRPRLWAFLNDNVVVASFALRLGLKGIFTTLVQYQMSQNTGNWVKAIPGLVKRNSVLRFVCILKPAIPPQAQIKIFVDERRIVWSKVDTHPIPTMPE